MAVTSTALAHRARPRWQQVIMLLVLVVGYGARADALAEALEPGDLVTVQGTLGWRVPPSTKTSPKPVGQ